MTRKTTDKPSFAGLLERYGCGPIRFTGTGDALFERHLMFDTVADPAEAGPRQQYEALARSMRDILSQRWRRTEQAYDRANAKRIYYMSLEFLIGRSLANNILNLRLDPVARSIVEEAKIDWTAMVEEEPDAGLGNGGLGRLAACFLDSMATMQLPAMGYGLRYEYGIFRQAIENGWQREHPDNWLRYPDPWEVARPQEAVEIKLGSSFTVEGGTLRAILGKPSRVLGIPYDRPIVGYGGQTINTLRLWAASTPEAFDLQAFSAGAFVSALAHRLAADSVTRVLYPDDSTAMGRGLRFVQEYFLVACSLADLVRRFRRYNTDWNALPDKVAVQLNDTHPSLAVPELMRILLDEAGLEWDRAWDITKRTLAYTNHTLLPEALEKWPFRWLELMLPRHLQIILDINQRLLDEVRIRFPGEEDRVRQVSLVEEGGERHVRMANLAIVGSHSTNGVAAIHSRLLRTVTVKALADLFPDRFNNKTNGVTPRRWLLMANPALADCITGAIGDGWITDLTQLAKLRPLADDAGFRDGVRKAKHQSKARFADWLKSTAGVIVAQVFMSVPFMVGPARAGFAGVDPKLLDASAAWMHAEGIEVIPGNQFGAGTFRLPLERHTDRKIRFGGQATEDLILVAQIGIHRIRKRFRAIHFIGTDVSVSETRGIQQHQFLRMRNGQSLQEYLPENGKNAGVGADAERQGEHRDGGEPRPHPEHPDPVAEVLQDMPAAASLRRRGAHRGRRRCCRIR
jgi:starch phosphorylase